MLYNDDFRNHWKYKIPKAQFILSDIPYNLGINAYASNPVWFFDRNISRGKSEKAYTNFFDTDINFSVEDYIRVCSELLDDKNGDECVLTFCSFEQQFELIKYGKEYGFKHYIPLTFIKSNSGSVLKAHQKYCRATEYAIVLYKNRLPKWNNNKRMVLDWFNFRRQKNDIHPTKKPLELISQLVKLHTDEGDVVIDLTAGSGTTLVACKTINRKSFGFEIDKEYFDRTQERLNSFAHSEDKNGQGVLL
jgi:site-specific DNA-methyltransferase (adenine-specific)